MINWLKKHWEVISYLIFGVLTTLLNIVLYALFNRLFGYTAANSWGNVLDNILCILFAYATNRAFVFRSKTRGREMAREFGTFVTCRLGTMLLDTAIMLVLGNAVKYTPAGGKIAVSVVLWEMYVEVKVTDTGKGISESNQAAIFRRFYREEEVHEQQGVGIGLYLAREIVMRQGGYVKVVSEPGKGSEFSIMLPTK